MSRHTEPRVAAEGPCQRVQRVQRVRSLVPKAPDPNRTTQGLVSCTIASPSSHDTHPTDSPSTRLYATTLLVSKAARKGFTPSHEEQPLRSTALASDTYLLWDWERLWRNHVRHLNSFCRHLILLRCHQSRHQKLEAVNVSRSAPESIL